MNHNKQPHWAAGRKGSIMIWVVALGFIMMTSFFLFSMRQRMTLEVRRETADIMDAQMYMESLAEYFMEHPETAEEGGKVIDKVNYTLTRKTDTFEGSLDMGESKEFPFSGSVRVEWNRCGDNDNMKADILLNDDFIPYAENLPCEGYMNLKTISTLTVGKISLKAPGAPFFYRIHAIDPATIDGPEWSLTMNKPLDYGKIVTVEKTFPFVP